MDSLNVEAFAKMVTGTRPVATAFLHGKAACPTLSGLVRFYPAAGGTQVVAEVFGLPDKDYQLRAGEAMGPFFGFHIHQGERCGSAEGAEPFGETGGHLDTGGERPHPYHTGDLPPLLGERGYAYMSVYTGRFTPQEVLGKTVVIHQHRDDLHSQPAGDSGMKLACGVIVPTLR